MDRWSDLDLRITLARPVQVSELVAAPLWAWQESVGEDGQRLRLVFADGRRVDAIVSVSRIALPEPSADNAIRFDGALAAARLGRGNDLIGVHLVLGILREALVQAMLLADRDERSAHHRHGSPFDARAADVTAVLNAASGPQLAMEACRIYGEWRRELEPAYTPDWTALAEIIGPE
ncbi:MAG: hypothetical protein FWF16_06890 [Microbacteriaceae bacterium]|nr:hypothetical protein [Microbacteriaceae bacterium]